MSTLQQRRYLLAGAFLLSSAVCSSFWITTPAPWYRPSECRWLPTSVIRVSSSPIATHTYVPQPIYRPRCCAVPGLAASSIGETNEPASTNPMSAEDGSEGDDASEIQRYKNRALLTQHLLKDKVSQLELVQAKLVVLQNVSQQLVEQRQDVARQLRDETRRHREAQEALRKVEAAFNATLGARQAKLDRVQAQKEEAERRAGAAEKSVQALQTELLKLDEQFEQTQAKLVQLEKESEVNQQDFQFRERKLKQQIAQLQTSLSQAQEQNDQEKVQAEEQIQIAVAAVEAANKREQALRREVAKLQADCERFAQENNRLRDEQIELEQGGFDDGTLDDMQKQTALLQQEIDQLKEHIQSMRLTHSLEMLALKEKLSSVNNVTVVYRAGNSEVATTSQKRSWWRRLARRIIR